MDTALLATKLHIPSIRSELVPRPRLTGRLDEGLERKLTLVSAPAGFGKTTLVSEWAAGWPSNINSTHMEVLEVAEDSLTVGGASFNQPILLRDCPPDPVRIVLREDGAIGGSGSACPHPEPCIFFALPATASPFPTLLPH